MSATTPLPITDDLLRRAWRDVRRPGWPDFESTLADPARGGLVRARAAAMAHGTPTHAPPQRWPFALAPQPSRHPTPRRPAGHDAKSAAAGEQPDADDTQPPPLETSP